MRGPFAECRPSRRSGGRLLACRSVADLLLTEGTLVDGSGSAPFAGWVAVTGDRIESVGRSDETPPAAGVVVATPGQIVAPGFIDVHNHSDLSPFVLPEMPSTLRQGVTSVVVGNCGSSPWPLSSWDESLDLAYSHAGALPRPAWASWRDYLDAIDEARPAVNIATLIGHGSVRRDVLGDERRAAHRGGTRPHARIRPRRRHRGRGRSLDRA